MGTSVFLKSLIWFCMSSSRKVEKLCGERRAPSCRGSSLLLQLSTTSRYSCPEHSSDPDTPTKHYSQLFTKHPQFPEPLDPPSLQICEIPPSQPSLWAPQHHPRLLRPLPLHPFHAAFSNRTPTKTIPPKLQQTSLEFPIKLTTALQQSSGFAVSPNTRENTSARHWGSVFRTQQRWQTEWEQSQDPISTPGKQPPLTSGSSHTLFNKKYSLHVNEPCTI